MSKTLSVDLPDRVLAAVDDGLSRREAGDRFGVSAASVRRRRTVRRETGGAQPKRLGGDRRSGRIEAQALLIRSLLDETPDITIEELRFALARPGHAFGFGSIRRFFARHAITRKKDASRQGTATTGRPDPTARLV